MKPLGSRLYVERIRPAVTPGGIHLPETFKAGKHGSSARQKVNAIEDTFRATVLAIGPDVRELSPGDIVVVFSFAEGDGSKLYTGESVGEKGRMFIGLDDVVCAIEPEEAAAE